MKHLHVCVTSDMSYLPAILTRRLLSFNGVLGLSVVSQSGVIDGCDTELVFFALSQAFHCELIVINISKVSSAKKPKLLIFNKEAQM